MKTAAIALLILVVAILAWFLVAPPAWISERMATSTPSVTENENTDTENTGTSIGTWSERVVIDAPKANARVFKNFTVTGKAPGPWYFEASFPIEVRSSTGTVVATGHATALSEWMTTDDVAFKAEITVSSYVGPATLVLMRDNASGLPENDGSVSIPITIEAQ